MAHEYYAVIVEFSAQKVALGFAGEPQFHVCVTPTSPLWKKFVYSDNEIRYPTFLGLGSHALLAEDKDKLRLCLSEDEKSTVSQYNKDYGTHWLCWKNDKFRALSRLVKHLILALLLISNASAKLFIIDGGMAAVEKALLCESLFAQNAAVAVTFLPRSPCLAISGGVENGTLVHFGWNECCVVCVCDLRCVSSRSLLEYSGESIHYLMVKSMRMNQDGDFALVSTEMSIENETLQSLFSKDGLPARIAAEILALDIDSRPLVALNILFSGELALVLGLTEKIIEQVNHQLGTLQAQQTPCLGAWAGASLYCSVGLLRENPSKWKHKEITREKLSGTGWKELQYLNT